MNAPSLDLHHGRPSLLPLGADVSMTWPQYLRSQARIDGALVRLPAFTRDTLLVLMLNRGKTLDATALVEAVWPDPDTQPDVGLRYVQRHIYELRRCGVPIETIKGSNRGWRLPIAIA